MAGRGLLRSAPVQRIVVTLQPAVVLLLPAASLPSIWGSALPSALLCCYWQPRAAWYGGMERT